MRVDQFSVICNAPCDTEIPAGTYQLGVAQGSGDALRAGAPVDLRGLMNLHIAYDDRTGLRVAGWISFIVGWGVGLGLALHSALGREIRRRSSSARASLGGVGLAVGLPLVFLNDAAGVEVRF